MDFISSNTMLLAQRSMDYLWQKQSVIADNVANAETPGYKAKYVTFEQELRSRIEAASKQPGTAKGSAVRDSILQSGIVTREANETTRLDENGVNVTEQNVELSRAYLQYQLTTRAFSEEISRLRAAIRG